MLSILLPSYNNKCYTLVHELQRQCEEYFASTEEGKEGYEVIVADDGSRDQVALIANLLINELPNCRWIRRKENVGRAAIRNFLASEAKGDLLLFMDSDVEIVRQDFIRAYMEAMKENAGIDIIDGGVVVTGPSLPHNLRYIYEKKAEPLHTAELRNKVPFQHFHTANIILRRHVTDKCRYDESLQRYGYEDVLFGKQLAEAAFRVLHIDNPVGLGTFEANEIFLRKTRDAMLTLREKESDLRGYSHLLSVKDRIGSIHMLWAVRLFHRLSHSFMERQLCGKSPSLLLFNVWKLGVLTEYDY